MQPTNALMEFREIEKKTVPGIKAFQMNSMLNRKRNRNDEKKNSNHNTAHEFFSTRPYYGHKMQF